MAAKVLSQPTAARVNGETHCTPRMRQQQTPHEFPVTAPPSNSAAFAATLEHGLSPREIEVAELLMKGHTVSAIAGKLFISENTTRGHAKSIYKKLAIHSRQELVDLDDQLTRA